VEEIKGSKKSGAINQYTSKSDINYPVNIARNITSLADRDLADWLGNFIVVYIFITI